MKIYSSWEKIPFFRVILLCTLFIAMGPGACIIKLITDVILRISVISQNVCPRQAFPAQSSVCSFMSLPQSCVPKMCFSRVGSGHTRKHQTKLERLVRDKQSSLLRKSVNYGRNKFYDTVPRSLDCLLYKAWLSTIEKIQFEKAGFYLRKHNTIISLKELSENLLKRQK